MAGAKDDARLRTASLTVDDTGLLAKLLPAWAKEEGVQPEELVQTALTGLAAFAAQQGPDTLKSLDAVASFIADWKAPKGPLVLGLKPAKTAGLSDLDKVALPDALTTEFGFTATYPGTKAGAAKAGAEVRSRKQAREGMMKRRTLVAAGLVLPALRPAMAQDAYPSKPVQIFVPFPPGGVADITARPLAHVMGRLAKQSIVVVNKPGAGGSVGAAQAARAAPDGYTLLLALSSISVLPVADRLQGRPAAYELDQFAPVALISADPTVLVVRADGPYKTLKDLVDAAKAKPGTINYGSSGVYGTLHVAMEIFAQAAGIKMFHIPYQGGGPAVAALLAGQIDALASGPAPAIGQIKAGKMRALAVWGDKRLAAMPDVPSMKELGYDATFYIWSGLFAPAATPQPVMTALRELVKRTVEDPEFKEAMAKVETPIAYLDAPQFKTFLDRDAAMLKVAVERIGKVPEN